MVGFILLSWYLPGLLYICCALCSALLYVCSAVRLLRCTSCVCPAVCLLHCMCLCVCVSDAHGAHGPHLLRRPRRLLFCWRVALRSDRVPGSPSPNELLQLMATTYAHVVCSVCQCCRPPSIALGASWSPSVLRTHNLCLSAKGAVRPQCIRESHADG